MKKAKKTPVPEKKKEQPKQEKDDKRKAKKTETATATTPKQSAKAKKAEETAQRKQEIKEYREMEHEGGDWNVVKPKKKTNKTDEATPLVNGNATAAPKQKKDKKDNIKEIKDRVNNELKNEDTIKAAISEIKGNFRLFF